MLLQMQYIIQLFLFSFCVFVNKAIVLTCEMQNQTHHFLC